ncbi:MAG: xanthine dehydrogenase family protein molybdopterin-binding subunit, partial [Myxococcota bacterium]
MSGKELRLGFPGKERVESVDVPEGSPPPWGLDAELRVAGTDHPRVDALLKVTGAARYSYDIRRPGMIYAGLLVSPHAHAKIVKVDLSKARALPGVLYTEAHEGKTVRYAGDHVAGVAAESEEVLDDALRLIDVEYEVYPHAVTVDDAQREDAPKVKNEGNVAPDRRNSGTPEAVEAQHAEADVVIERLYRTQVQTHSALETHGCVCEWEGDKLTVWSSTQGTFSVQEGMAGSLGVPVANVRVICEHMGGGFGAKFSVSYWDVFCAKAARETRRPVRCMLDRKQEHLAAGNRPSSLQRCKFSAKRDGTL